MGIYRSPNGVVTEGQTSCPLCAKGAISPLAWGNRPRHSLRYATALKARFNVNFVSIVNRAFSAVGVLISRILGHRPRLAMIRRRWRDRILSGHTAFTFQIVQAFV